MNITYKHCQAESVNRKEHNDCAVKALAITAGIPYGKAHDIMRIMGRKNGRGFRHRGIYDMVTKYTMAVKLAGRQAGKLEYPTGYTMRTITERCQHGSYLVFMRGHVAAVVNGEVMDWTKGRLHRVTSIMRVGV